MEGLPPDQMRTELVALERKGSFVAEEIAGCIDKANPAHAIFSSSGPIALENPLMSPCGMCMARRSGNWHDIDTFSTYNSKTWTAIVAAR